MRDDVGLAEAMLDLDGFRVVEVVEDPDGLAVMVGMSPAQTRTHPTVHAAGLVAPTVESSSTQAESPHPSIRIRRLPPG